MAGRAVQMAGRSTPGRVLSTKRAVAIRAPVLPALTQAWALPSFTRLIDNSSATVEEMRKNYMDANADIHRKMLRLLDEITRTSQSIKNLTDYLNRHPESLLRGR